MAVGVGDGEGVLVIVGIVVFVKVPSSVEVAGERAVCVPIGEGVFVGVEASGFSVGIGVHQNHPSASGSFRFSRSTPSFLSF